MNLKKTTNVQFDWLKDENGYLLVNSLSINMWCGGTVVNVLCYKSEGRWFDSRWCHWNFSLT